MECSKINAVVKYLIKKPERAAEVSTPFAKLSKLELLLVPKIYDKPTHVQGDKL